MDRWLHFIDTEFRVVRAFEKLVVYAVIVGLLLPSARLLAQGPPPPTPTSAASATTASGDIMTETSALANAVDPFAAFAVFVVLMAQRIRAASTLPQDFSKMAQTLRDYPRLAEFNYQMRQERHRLNTLTDRYDKLKDVFSKEFRAYEKVLLALKKQIHDLRGELPKDMDEVERKKIITAIDHWKEHDIGLLEKLLQKRGRPTFFDKGPGAEWLSRYRALRRQEGKLANDVVHSANKVTREVNPELPELEKFSYFGHRSPIGYGENRRYIRDPGHFWTRGGEGKSLLANELPDVVEKRCEMPLNKIAGTVADLRIKGTVWGAFQRVPDILSPVGTSLSLVAVFYATYATARQSYRKYGSLLDPFNPNGKAAMHRRAIEAEQALVDASIEDRSEESERRLRPFVRVLADKISASREMLMASADTLVAKHPGAHVDKKRMEALLSDRADLEEAIADAIPAAIRKEWPGMRFGQLLRFLALSQSNQLPKGMSKEDAARYESKVREKQRVFMKHLLQIIFSKAATGVSSEDEPLQFIGERTGETSDKLVEGFLDAMATTQVPVPANTRDHIAFPRVPGLKRK